MAISTEPEQLWDEIKVAEEFRDRHLADLDDVTRRYTGAGYRGADGEASDLDTCDDHPENVYQEYVSYNLPKTVYHNPRFMMSSRRGRTQRMVAQALRFGMNRWVKNINAKKILTLVALDHFFKYGVVLTTNMPQPRYSPITPATPRWPMWTRLSPKQWGMDPWAINSILDARFQFHRWWEDKDSLLARAKHDPKLGWNTEQIETAAKESSNDPLKRPNRHGNRERTMVEAVEIWIPEIQQPGASPDDGFYGSVYTLSQGPNGGVQIRKPQPFFGHRTGPYAFFGVYPVMDEPYPLAPLSATKAQINELNAQARSANISARQYKRLVIVDSSRPDLVQKLQAPDSFILSVEGLANMTGGKAVEVVELGGVSEQQIVQLTMLRNRADRMIGMDDLQRGIVDGRGTATAQSIAAESSGVRFGWVKGTWIDGVKEAAIKAAHYFYYDDRVIFPLDEEASVELGMEEPWFYGGMHDPESGATLDDIDLDIEPFSMEHSVDGPVQRNTMTMADMVMGAAPMIPQTPWIRWKKLLDDVGDVLNKPGLGDLVDVDMAMQMAGAPAQPPNTQPRLGKDLGRAGTPPIRVTPGNRQPVQGVGGGLGPNVGLQGNQRRPA